MTVRQSRVEPGGAKAQIRTLSMPYLVLGSPVAVFRGIRSAAEFVGRSKAKAYCLRSGGLVPRSLSHVNNPG
jgi:hypothetical protein